MSFVIAAPEMLAAAATDLERVGSAITAGNAAAAASTTRVVAAGADEVSAAVAALFGAHAQGYQAVGAQAAAFHERFVRALSAAGSSYVSTEAVNAERMLSNVANAPTHALLGHPLIGDRIGLRALQPTAANSPLVVRNFIDHALDARSGSLPSIVSGSGELVNLGGLLSGNPFVNPFTTWLDVATATVTNLTSLTQFIFSSPAPILAQFIANQIGYLTTAGAAAQGLAVATAQELGQLPATLQLAFGYLASGDVVDGIGTLWGYISNFPENVAIASLGTLLPALSIPSEVVTHLGNLVSVNTLLELSSLLSGVPYYPLNATVAAFATTAQDILTAAGSGDFVTIFSDLVNFPATITGAFLNGFPDPTWGTLTGTDPAVALLTNPTTGPDFGSIYNILLARETVAGALDGPA